MEVKCCVLPGDGIGPEIMDQALKVLRSLEQRFGHRFDCQEHLLGGAAVDKEGSPLPEQTVSACKQADVVLLGAVGGPRWDGLQADLRPEKGLLGIRKALELYANLRPAVIFDGLQAGSLLREDIVAGGIDLLVVRELTGGIYFGTPRGCDGSPGKRVAYNTMRYSEAEIRRIGKLAFELAMRRNKRLCSVDKANVLEVSRLWREVIAELGDSYPQVELQHMYVDNAAMQLVRNPAQFDVLVTSNLFGDILSDEAAIITGSIGLLPSASLGDQGGGLFEPVHGSAPDIAGQDKANPLAAILSLAMMFKYGLSLDREAALVEQAVAGVLAKGYRTVDLYRPGTELLGCSRMGDVVAQEIGDLPE